MPKASLLPELARSVGTPFYCYSAATIRRHFTVFSQALSDMNAMVCYAMKANSNQAVLTLLAKLVPAWMWSRKVNCAAPAPRAFPASG